MIQFGIRKSGWKMVSFERLCLAEDIPIYLQIIRFVKQEIAAGNVDNREEMPSRRVLSALLGVNPNTIQKAYRILEEEEIIESHTGAKSYVTADSDKVLRIRAELLESDALSVVKTMKSMGISKAEALELIDRFWDEEEKTDTKR